jgi:hypothetical protein
MDKYKLNSELFRLAHRQSKKTEGFLTVDAPVDKRLLASHLRKLAGAASGMRRMSPDQVLSTFFTDDAVEVLLKLPNLYWLWETILGASVWQDVLLIDGRIDLRAVNCAYTRLCSISAGGQEQSLSPVLTDEQLRGRFSRRILVARPSGQ